MTHSNAQTTKYLETRFNFETRDAANTIFKTVAETEAEDEAKLVKRWAFAIKEQRECRLLCERIAPASTS